MDSTVHPAWLSVFSGRRHAHQLSSAEEHAADAGERLRGTRAGPGRLWGGDRAALPLLQLRRLHVHHGPPPCPPPRTGEGIVFELLAEEAGARGGGPSDTPRARHTPRPPAAAPPSARQARPPQRSAGGRAPSGAPRTHP